MADLMHYQTLDLVPLTCMIYSVISFIGHAYKMIDVVSADGDQIWRDGDEIPII